MKNFLNLNLNVFLMLYLPTEARYQQGYVTLLVIIWWDAWIMMFLYCSDVGRNSVSKSTKALECWSFLKGRLKNASYMFSWLYLINFNHVKLVKSYSRSTPVIRLPYLDEVTRLLKRPWCKYTMIDFTWNCRNCLTV